MLPRRRRRAGSAGSSGASAWLWGSRSFSFSSVAQSAKNERARLCNRRPDFPVRPAGQECPASDRLSHIRPPPYLLRPLAGVHSQALVADVKQHLNERVGPTFLDVLLNHGQAAGGVIVNGGKDVHGPAALAAWALGIDARD